VPMANISVGAGGGGQTLTLTPDSSNPALIPVPTLIYNNGNTTGQRIRQGDLVAKRLAAKKEPTDIIDEVFVRCLTRRPTDAEKQKLMAMVASETDKKKALEDVFWAVLNSREFMFNH